MANEKFDFFQSYGNIDIWFAQDTKAGKTKYMFWFMGKTYESEDRTEILNTAKACINKSLGRGSR